LPEAGFALKLARMPLPNRIRTAWDCPQCRAHRGLALAFAALALVAWMAL
jgi:hypothetical protein